jgi:hypothetical protein
VITETTFSNSLSKPLGKDLQLVLELSPTVFRQRATRLHLYKPSPFTAPALLLFIAFVGFDTIIRKTPSMPRENANAYSRVLQTLRGKNTLR